MRIDRVKDKEFFLLNITPSPSSVFLFELLGQMTRIQVERATNELMDLKKKRKYSGYLPIVITEHSKIL